MYKKIRNYFILVFFLISVFFIIKYYFSEQNLIYTNRVISTYSVTSKDKISNLPLLKNNTENIIIYKNDLEEFKKLKKKRVWEKIFTNNE